MEPNSQIRELLNEAVQAKKSSYAPYSKFRVGVALRTKSGKIFRGCNVENASFDCGLSAQQIAIFNAVSEGFLEFEAMAIAR